MREVNDDMVMRWFHQRSAKKKEIKRGKTYEEGMFQAEHETENEKEQGVVGE